MLVRSRRLRLASARDPSQREANSELTAPVCLWHSGAVVVACVDWDTHSVRGLSVWVRFHAFGKKKKERREERRSLDLNLHSIEYETPSAGILEQDIQPNPSLIKNEMLNIYHL